MEECIIEEQGGKGKKRVADDSGDGRHEYWVNKERVYYCRVKERAPEAGTLGQTEVDLFIIHRNYRVDFAIAGVVYEMELTLGCHYRKCTL